MKIILFLILWSLVSGCEPASKQNIFLTDVGCESIDTVHSKLSDYKVSINFINKNYPKANLYWVDFEGKEVLYNIIDKGKEAIQETFTTHIWVIRDDSGKCLRVFVPSNEGAFQAEI
ncbi:hypothetical protein [Neptunicella sp.]|uniref:VHL beta domain-containing protein n=1 Tax=Neptunicella sp. TaxID=2125986 RepID=UPI003F68E376